MFKILTTNKFEKDFQRCIKRGLDINIITNAMKLLEISGTLPQSYRPHKLTGNYKGCWECHLQSDWLMVWQQDNNELTLLFTDTGSHSDLFK